MKLYIPVDESKKDKTTIEINLYSGYASTFTEGENGTALETENNKISINASSATLVEKDGVKYVLVNIATVPQNGGYLANGVFIERTVTSD